MLGHLFDSVPDIPEFLKHINQTATTVLESPMTLAHHSNVTLVPFCLCPSFLYSYLLYFLFSCSASSCWQPFLFISLPPSLFLNPALVSAPLVCSLSLLFQAFQPDTSYFPFHLHRGRNPENRDTSCFILQENSISHPSCAAGASAVG